MSERPAGGPSSRDRVLARVRAAIAAGAPAGAAGPGSATGSAAEPGGVAGGAAEPGGAAGRAERELRVDAEYAALPREYLTAHHDPAVHDVVTLFAERAADYRAVVERVPASALPSAVARILASRAVPAQGGASMITEDSGHIAPKTFRDHGSAGAPAPADGAAEADEAAGGRSGAAPAQFVVPPGLPGDWLARCAQDSPGVALITDDPPLDTARLDATAGVVTGCAVAIAETGTIVLDHGPGQGRRAVTLVPDFHLVVVTADQVAADLPGAFARLDPARPHTLISGPSATSDIELVRVEGVHGPRTLHVLIADPG
jgi:L-lactate dehydrogenase complex protein LldG